MRADEFGRLDQPAPGDVSFLEGGGELGALMRAHDWSRTPLGSPASWPRSLKTAVRIMLTSRQPFWLGWGAELTYLYNDAYKAIIGGKHPHALGRPFAEVWREIWDVVGPMGEAVMARDEGIYVEAQQLIMERHGYQEETYYTFSYSPIPDDDGRPGGLICANTDDTRRVIGERQLALLRELAARSGSARSWTDAARLAVDALAANRHDIVFAVLLVAGDEGGPAFACGTPGSEALHDPSLWGWPERARASDLAIVSLEHFGGTLPTGAWARPPARAAVLPIAAPEGAGRAGMLAVGLNPFRVLDESYRGFLELVVRQLAAGIANGEAYDHERRRAEELAQLDRAKTQFFSNVSHEFRTPLTLLLGPVDDLIALREADGGEERALLEVVRRNGQRLLKLVNTLLDFARIEAGRVDPTYQPSDVAALTADLASSFRSACERAGLRLGVACEPIDEPLYLDRDMWEKVVLNLLSNAFKFTFEGGIDVELRDGGAHVELVVRDTGTGIPSEALPRMFERFHRIESARGRSHEGSGIGLALVQELVKLHGGTIEVASTLGAGSAFTVSIPKGDAHLPGERIGPRRDDPAEAASRAGAYVDEAMSWLPRAEPVASETAQGAPRILLADDNADLREYARRLLAEHYEVEAVADGEAALEAARARRPDLVVSDVMMPRRDGFELLRALRADPALETVPVILLSARAGEEERIAGIGQGADDYLVKPFRSRELLVRVGALIQAAELRRRALEQEKRATERQREMALEAATAAEINAKFRAFFDQGAYFAGVMALDGTLVEANRLSLEATGFAREDVIGRKFWDCGWWAPSPALQQMAREAAARAAAGRTTRHETIYYLADGSVRWVDLVLAPVTDASGRVLFIAPTGIDVTDRKRAEEALQRANDELRESARAKDEFIATLSHELRNPLAPLRNALQLLRLAGSDETARAATHAMMERQVEHLVRLVDDLLEASRISRGALELRRQAVPIEQVVQHALDTCRPLIERRRHHLELSLPAEPLWLDGDPVRLAQILTNLLNNAALYTDPGGHILVSAVRDDPPRDRAIVSVRDDGAGIAPDAVPRIFEMFGRGQSAQASGTVGLGIGLALARTLAEMHGGTLEARSDGPGTGSEFRVTLPLASPPAAAAGEAAPRPGPTAIQRILVVDDNRDAADSLAMVLELLGAEARAAHDGAGALELLRSYEADVVLLDIGMPGMDGYEVARRIRSGFPALRATLVALTGWGQEEDRRRAREAGFDHHLIKPAEIGALRTLLESLRVERDRV